MEIDIKAMADKLVELRGSRTQEEVAKNVGISTSALAMYETGKRVPRDPVKVKLSRYYKRSVTAIFFIEKGHET